MKSLKSCNLFLIFCFLQPGAAQTRVWSHQPLTKEVKTEIRKQRPNLTDYSIREIELFGIRGKLTTEQWEELRRRTVPELSIIRIFDAHGITPEMSDALKGVGVDFEDSEKWRERGPGHYAAMADAVVLGRVQKIEYHVEGPYHTWLRVHPEEFLKGVADGDEVIVKILDSGPARGENGEILMTESEADPKFRLGERVLLFLQKWPRDLLYVQRVYRNLTPPDQQRNLERQYGSAQAIRAELEKGDYYELLWEASGAFRIVGDRAVSKLRALRVPNPNAEKFRLKEAKQLIGRVGEVQRKFRSTEVSR
ncbi:MAG: hypothetical protein ACRD5W_01310 [Candidatus Acidiferrales bacterium]